MIRDAKLYILFRKDWQPLVDRVLSIDDKKLLGEITIFQLYASSSKVPHFAIISLSDEVDKIIEEYGGNAAEEKDQLRNSLHYYNGEPLFGDKTNLAFLNRI